MPSLYTKRTTHIVNQLPTDHCRLVQHPPPPLVNRQDRIRHFPPAQAISLQAGPVALDLILGQSLTKQMFHSRPTSPRFPANKGLLEVVGHGTVLMNHWEKARKIRVSDIEIDSPLPKDRSSSTAAPGLLERSKTPAQERVVLRIRLGLATSGGHSLSMDGEMGGTPMEKLLELARRHGDNREVIKIHIILGPRIDR
ncbi:hypothetical protein HRR83_007299 [Exophiala dermatitidis]|nr:hypothetical protein HRR73_006590 [Exophiala dermatitidis]KAJ4550987.1 hypothetical protein HRR77_003338 [Exophiala dermatitidis]KAJ4560862.1 hypothetical protein HRR79_007714 [Exophiala dermatitidis]KAJ4591998.1 hypothetical protein HRR83_007299 [Exophiala dermatitidis]KAJ4617554.1 hypothetical protein HRR85_002550 [Exophiala dermatitidis]